MRQREGPKTRGKPVKLPLCLIVSFVSLKIDTIGAFLLLGLRNCVHLYVSLLASETETVRQDGPRAVIWPKYATFAVSQARPAVRRNETSGIVPTTMARLEVPKWPPGYARPMPPSPRPCPAYAATRALQIAAGGTLAGAWSWSRGSA